MRKDRMRQEARRDELTRRLADGSMSEAERKSLAAEIETVSKFLASLDDPAGNPEERSGRRGGGCRCLH